MLAVWAGVLGFKCSLRTVIDLKDGRADLAAQLRADFPVVVVQVLMRGFAEGTLFGLWDRFPVSDLDGFKRPAMLGLISFKQCPVI
jgi:hypothetical protein